MTPIRRFLLVLALLSPVPTSLPAVAQPASTPSPVLVLPDAVITADRVPTAPEKVTGSVTVVTGDEMERRQLRTVTDVLRTVPGVSVQQSGGPGSLTAVFVRGTNPEHTVLLLDGMRVDDPSTANGAVDFAHFLTENLERIEIVRGPMSALYGSDAIGGVINMITKAGKGPLNGAAFTEVGTLGQTTAGAFARGSEGRLNYNFTFGGTYAPGASDVPARFNPPGGFVYNDPYRNLTIGSRLGFEIADNAQFTWFSRYIDTQVRFDQVAQVDPNATEFTQQFFNRVQFDGSFIDDRWKPTVGISYSNVYRHDQDFPSFQVPFPFTQDAYYNGRRLAADMKNQFIFSAMFDVVAGIDYDKTWLYANVDGLQSWGDATQVGFYAQARATLFDDLVLILGGRLVEHSQFGEAPTWRASAAYLFRETDTKLKGSYGTAFKAPALFELFGAGFFCAGNPNLQPERSRGYEFGVEQGLLGKKMKAGATYFFNSLENLIQCAPPFTSLSNVSQAQTEGFESFLRLSPVDWLDLAFDYTFLIARNVTQGTNLVRRPQDTFGGRADIRPMEGLRFGVGVTHVANRSDFDAISGAIVQPAAYTLLRATASYEVTKGLELFMRAENILDRQYEEPEGFKAPNFQAFLGVKVRY